MYKHYIRTNENNEIVKVFSDAFEQAIETDTLYKETEERHFNLNIKNIEYNTYNYKFVDSEIVENEISDSIILSKARNEKLSELNSEYQLEFTKGFTSNGGQFGCDYTDVSYFAFFKAGLINNEYTFPLDKKLKDVTGQYFVLDSKEQALMIIADGESHIDMLREEFEIKYNQILNCDTLEQLQ